MHGRPADPARPLVTIVTPSYNQAAYLEQTIQSVLAQTYQNIEYLIIDGGSTDTSVAVIQKYAQHLAYWHSRRDRGSADAIHQGFMLGHGKILAWLNSDDLLAPEAVERGVAALERHPQAVMVYGNRICIDSHGNLLYARPNLPILARSPYVAMTFAQESCFWWRTVYDQVGGLNCDLKFSFDYELFARFGQVGEIVFDGSIWGFFRKHPEARTMLKQATTGKQDDLIIQKALWGKPPPRLCWKAVSLLVKVYALAMTPFVKGPTWPACLPAKGQLSLARRFFDSMHETSRLKRLLRPCFEKH
jgi:glycosyltransferase involved in cell wall biosynthesis